VLPIAHVAEAATIITSIALLLWTAKQGRAISPKYQFALAVAFSVLVSYHLFVYDLTILLIPMLAAFYMAQRKRSSVVEAAVLIPLVAVPIGLLWRPFLLAVPVFAFLLMIAHVFAMQTGTEETTELESVAPQFRA
jgi:hypothetical protein